MAKREADKTAAKENRHSWVPTPTSNGGWVVPSTEDLAQREKDDRPSCSSDDGSPSASGYCPKTIAKREAANRPYPINYPVPNFGMDHDIVGTAASIK